MLPVLRLRQKSRLKEFPEDLEPDHCATLPFFPASGMKMYPAVPAKMTENTGERGEKREIRRMERKMNAVLLSVMDFLPNLMTVSKIKTHTQIRMPAKAWITNGFAAKLERNMAIAVMISMEGVMTPKVAARPPEKPFVYILQRWLH